MWATKFFLCRNAPKIGYPILINSSKSVPKTFSTLNCCSQNLFKKYNASQSFKLYNKRLIKSHLPDSSTAAITAQKSNIVMQRNVGGWLICCCGMVYLTIMYGGLTRLTEAGLSMVTWRFTFEKYPSTEEEWEMEFKKYQEYPEFKLLKKDMTLDEFMKIWKTEYFHRTLGRCVGLIFLVPALSFWVRGFFSRKMKKRIIAFSLLIGAQGLMGWYMVKSGLEDRFHKEADVPRVSHYRLAAHLGLALTLYTGFFWTALDLLLPPEKPAVVSAGLARIRMLVHSCKGLVFLTALSGALVAGLDAGLIYNTFPKMGGKWIPDDILALSPSLKNFVENPTTVQFDHRILGMTTFSAIITTWLLSKKHKLPRRARIAMNLMAAAALLQVSLGIATLIHNVPVNLAIGHQSSSVMLLTMAIWAAHEFKLVKYISKF